MKSLVDREKAVGDQASGQREDIGAPGCSALSFREETRRIFVDVVQKAIIAAGAKPAPRPVFRKLHGVARGSLRIRHDLPDRFRHGLFAESSFTAWVRFSSDTSQATPDNANSTLGIAIKLFGVGRPTLDGDDPDAGTADLLLQNHDRFFVDTGQDFCAFSRAAVFGSLDDYLAAHPETKTVLDEMAKPEASALGATYWSVLPYACGSEIAVKYRLLPLGGPAAGTIPTGDPNYLRADLARRLAVGAARFEFAVQPFASEAETPLDAAMKRWPTPFAPVGELTIEQQDIGAAGQGAYGENLAFNPWRAPAANRPLGSVADFPPHHVPVLSLPATDRQRRAGGGAAAAALGWRWHPVGSARPERHGAGVIVEDWLDRGAGPRPRSGVSEMVFIDLPDRRQRSAGAGHPNGNGALVLGIEVTQAVQNMAHEVRLVAGKATAVRVYLEPHGLDSDLPVRGEILVSAGPGMPGTYVASANASMLRADQPLAAQRRDAALSLNFLLRAPPAGPMTVQLNRLFAGSGDMDFCLYPPVRTAQVTLIAAPVLRIRALGLRYRDPRQTPPRHFAPDPVHFNYLRSYLARVYPASRLDWTQAVIDAPPSFVPPFSAPLPDDSDPLWEALLRKLHVQMMLVRQADMDAGWDPRTHYYGLISDHSGFFRGAANDVPNRPAPNTVAVGPCGKWDPFWDDDASYGDWYGAHELAHTFGRRHPGFCKQERDDQHYPHPGGTISDAVQDCIGFDTGDADLNLPMRAYPHDSWVDFMTYCDRQWVSKYTYDGLYQRLIEEDEQFAPRVG